MIDSEICWQAIQRKDETFDGQFLYGVITTGVFCRPGCAARTPLRKNVRFYAAAVDAAADGLRACQRCKPLDAKPASPQTIATYILKNVGDGSKLKLAQLSKHFQLSPFHLQRRFKAAMGVTPRQYAEGIRVATLKEDLRTSTTVTEAIYKAGFGSSSAAYASPQLGMTPKQYSAGGTSVEISYVVRQTHAGLVLIGATDRGLCFLEFGPTPEQLLQMLKQEFPAANLMPMESPYPETFTAWMDSLDRFLAGEGSLPATPLDLHGTAFQLKVWRYLQTIPAGAVRTYGQVAEAIEHPRAVRAVASACAANRIALAVPCHRVIRGDGALGGYRWDTQRKHLLLDAEKKAARSR